jgi:protein-L-isoaspartate(D-aspartate) O-methyltransferase
MTDFTTLRRNMIEKQLEARGVRDRRVLDAVMAVPREQFVPDELVEFAYEDTPLPIASGQTISQPYIVALMAAALQLDPDDRVLEVGAGSGYAAAVLSRLAARVYTIERHEVLADSARAVLQRLDFTNVEVIHGDGTEGLPGQAPFDAIVVAAASPADIPLPLLEQLAVGGRMVIPAGSEDVQKLWRVTRTSAEDYQREDLGNVRFVPLIGRAGWLDTESTARKQAGRSPPQRLPRQIARDCEPFPSIEQADLDGLMERIGNARLVLLGEASHGTAEFYDMRARITRRLIEHKGFNVVAVEADWPDAAVIDGYVRDLDAVAPVGFGPFARFPTWMWANESVLGFVRWLHSHNAAAGSPQQQVGFYGLDLYSMYASIESVLGYLDDVDPAAAQIARERYGCLMPWSKDPAAYGRMALNERYRACEQQVVAMLKDLEDKRMDYVGQDGVRFFDAAQNARLIHSAERYYRAMYYGSRPSWNLRDQHMFDTLEAVLAFRGEQESRAVVWAHNSHLGDARATEMGAQGEHNVGQLVRERYGDLAYLIGFGTDHGTVAAASHWGGLMEVKEVRPALAGSYERLCHESSVPQFLLPLRKARGRQVAASLLEPHLERAIGVIYRPETERHSHYFQATLPQQFDEYIYFDETRAVNALPVIPSDRPPDTFPFGV